MIDALKNPFHNALDYIITIGPVGNHLSLKMPEIQPSAKKAGAKASLIRKQIYAQKRLLSLSFVCLFDIAFEESGEFRDIVFTEPPEPV